MDDLISRQAAIDAIGKTSDELYENIKKGATFPQRQWFDGMAQAQSILENLPSAQPYTDEEIQKMQDIEQAQLDKAYEMGKADALQWIPCSERLPEKKIMSYWVCLEIGGQCQCRWTNDMYGLGANEWSEWGWHVMDKPQYSKIVAWMPLPEPYKEGEQDG